MHVGGLTLSGLLRNWALSLLNGKSLSFFVKFRPNLVGTRTHGNRYTTLTLVVTKPVVFYNSLVQLGELMLCQATLTGGMVITKFWPLFTSLNKAVKVVGAMLVTATAGPMVVLSLLTVSMKLPNITIQR